jgi:HD-GYP domain-containing protein (c-di-GMP phosphodiesterase class II)
MLNEKQKLQEIIRLGTEMTQIQDLDILLEHILTEARKFVNADAGSIYKVEGDKLALKYSQNDTKQRLLPPGKKLIYSTFEIDINNNTISGYVAHTGEILNISDVYKIPPEVDYEYNTEYDKRTNYKCTSMLTIPLKTSRGDIVGVLQLINAQDEKGEVVPFSEEDVPMIKHFASNAAVALEKAAMTRTILLRMISMAELRDPKETGPHVNRVGAYSAELYEAWAIRNGIPQSEIEQNKDVLRMAAMLHDVGKVAISDLILKKPARLTKEEFETIKKHTYLGARLFSDAKSHLDEMAANIALSHHEKWDGSGYPGYIDLQTGDPLPGYEKDDGNAIGKKGEEISIWGRIVSIADVYDALSCKRVYKSAWSQEEVLEELKRQAGKQFDPNLIEIFLSILDSIQAIAGNYPD